MKTHGLVERLRAVAGVVFRIPIIGYFVRIFVGVVKLPRLNFHIRRQQVELSSLNTKSDALSEAHEHIREIEARQQVELSSLNTKSDALSEAWHQHIPAFLNAVTSVNAFGHELIKQRKRFEAAIAAVGDMSAQGAQSSSRQVAEIERQLGDIYKTNDKNWSSIGDLWNRLEFVRKEILFEMKYSGSASKSEPSNRPEPRIVNQTKYEQSTIEGVRLNLGCGHVALKKYLNVDMRDLPGVDIVAPVDNLPFSEKSVQEIFSAHVLEHFPQEQLVRSLLPYWKSLLSSGGIFCAVTPDAAAMVANLAKKTYSFKDFREVFFGGQEYEGDFHFNMFTPKSLTALLQDAGFVDVSVPVKARKNGKCFEFEIRAVRP